MLEIWRAGGSNTRAEPDDVRAVEDEGWDGQMFMDSQSLAPDPWTMMGAWARSSTRLKLSPGVTNPFTRNLAVTAASAASVQMLSGGRAVLGIGRGDSALAYLGHAPVGLAAFERALASLQALLRGEEIDFADTGFRGGDAPAHHTLSLGARPEGVRLNWLPADLPKVPLDVAATGPKVIAMGARLAERVTFSVGADAERLNWALGVARAAREAAGLPRDGVSWGAQVVVSCHADEDVAMEQAMRMAPSLARFQVIQGATAGPQAGDDGANLETIRTGYDMTKHGGTDSGSKLVAGGLSEDFVRRFAIVGTPDQCARRLLDLVAPGLERFVIVGPGFYPDAWGEARNLFARHVIPALRESA